MTKSLPCSGKVTSSRSSDIKQYKAFRLAILNLIHLPGLRFLSSIMQKAGFLMAPFNYCFRGCPMTVTHCVFLGGFCPSSVAGVPCTCQRGKTVHYVHTHMQ